MQKFKATKIGQAHRGIAKTKKKRLPSFNATSMTSTSCPQAAYLTKFLKIILNTQKKSIFRNRAVSISQSFIMRYFNYYYITIVYDCRDYDVIVEETEVG